MKFVTDNPKTNVERLLNYAHGKNDEVYIYDEEGDEVRLAEYVSKHCEMGYSADEIMDNPCMDCFECVAGTLNQVAILAAELRAKLARYEERSAEGNAGMKYNRLTDKSFGVTKNKISLDSNFRGAALVQLWTLENAIESGELIELKDGQFVCEEQEWRKRSESVKDEMKEQTAKAILQEIFDCMEPITDGDGGHGMFVFSENLFSVAKKCGLVLTKEN